MSITPYATADELKAKMGIQNVAQYDSILGDIMDAATVAIDNYCQRPVDGFSMAATATAREFVGDGSGVIRVDPFVEITVIEVKPTYNGSYETWALSDVLKFSGGISRPNFNTPPFTGLMIDPNSTRVDFTSGKGKPPSPTVRTTCKWGFADFTSDYGLKVEAILKMACLAQAGRWFAKVKGGWSDAIAPAGLGMVFYNRQLDGDIQMMLANNGLIDERL